MKDNTEKQIGKLVDGLNTEQQDAVLFESPDQKLRNSLLGFVSNQVEQVAKLDNVMSLALQNLYTRLESNELDADKVLSIISTLSNKKTDLTAAILEPFKAAPGGSSALLPPAERSSEMTSFDKGIKDLSPDQLKLFDKMFRSVIDASKKNDSE